MLAQQALYPLSQLFSPGKLESKGKKETSSRRADNILHKSSLQKKESQKGKKYHMENGAKTVPEVRDGKVENKNWYIWKSKGIWLR